MKFNIEGMIAPVFTPMDDAGNIKYDVIPQYMEHLERFNIKGILVGGTTGEAALLNVVERKQLLTAWITAAKPSGTRVISQVGGAPLPDVIELAKFSEGLKADAIMTLPELYYKPRTVNQLVDYLQIVSNAAPTLPLIYYHFPMMTGVDLNMRDFFSTAKSRIPNFKGMKADLGDALRVVNVLDSDQRIFMANHHLAQAALMGYESSIATVTNIYPMFVSDILEHVRNGDVLQARTEQIRLNRLVDAISAYGDFVPAMKVAMEFVTGVKVGPPRQPLTRLSQSTISKLNAELDRLPFLTEEEYELDFTNRK